MPHTTRGRASHTIVHAARELRRTMTPAELRLWEALRGHRLAGLKFRRQHPLDRFILDFFCVEKQLAVELDGAVHAQPDRTSHDEERTEWLNSRGIRVLRFKNEEIEDDLDGVLRKIVEASSPNPLLLNQKA